MIKMEGKNESKHIYLAIDLFYLKALTIVQNKIDGKTIEPHYYFRRMDELSLLKKNLSYIEKILELSRNEDGIIRLMIVNSIYQWRKKDPAILEFMKNYCYFDHVNQDNYKYRQNAINAIADSYCEQIEWRGENLSPLADKIYHPGRDCEEVPFCVYPIAESAYARANYLCDRFASSSNTEFVLAVNEHMDCYDITEAGLKLVPSIISIDDIKSFLDNPTEENKGRLIASSDMGRRKVGKTLAEKVPKK